MPERRPLDRPTDRSLLSTFLARFSLTLTGHHRQDVAIIAHAFSQIPYENLTKVLSKAHHQQDPLRTPQIVLHDHGRFGAGGTCFSLTATLLSLVRSLGLRAEPILADRPYGQRTHSALLVWIDDVPHLVDPGFLLTEPIPIGIDQPIITPTSFNSVILTPAATDQLSLATDQQGKITHRLTFRTTPADAGEFLSAWRDSFQFDMMHYPLLTKVAGNRQLYLQGNRLQIRTKDHVSTERIPLDHLLATICSTFGLAPELAKQAIDHWHSQGDLHG
jgi:arylamine N-acetyltransferase